MNNARVFEGSLSVPAGNVVFRHRANEFEDERAIRRPHIRAVQEKLVTVRKGETSMTRTALHIRPLYEATRDPGRAADSVRVTCALAVEIAEDLRRRVVCISPGGGVATGKVRG